MEQIKTDGGSGSGRYPKGSGDTGQANPQQRALNNSALVGQKTKTGQTINTVSDHAHDRIVERGRHPNFVKFVMQDAESVTPGNTANTSVYSKGTTRVIFDDSTGTIVTVTKQKGKR